MHWLLLHPRKCYFRHLLFLHPQKFASVILFTDGIFSDLCNKLESVSNALLILTPACRAGNVFEAGWIIIDTMSVADCFRKSVKVTAGKGIAWGKDSTVSLSTSDLVRGM